MPVRQLKSELRSRTGYVSSCKCASQYCVTFWFWHFAWHLHSSNISDCGRAGSVSAVVGVGYLHSPTQSLILCKPQEICSASETSGQLSLQGDTRFAAHSAQHTAETFTNWGPFNLRPNTLDIDCALCYSPNKPVCVFYFLISTGQMAAKQGNP